MDHADHPRTEHDRRVHAGGHGEVASSWQPAISATLHCLTGCAIGEVLGMVLATWWGWSTWPSVLLAVVLAFFFGYLLTVTSVRRAGVPFGQAVRVALAADTVAFVVTLPVNRWMIARGRGHAVVHEYHH